MAHIEKYGKGSTGKLCQHYERKKDENGQYIKFGNQDIDLTRTHENYNLAPLRDNQVDFIRKRCAEVQCLNRKDVKVMCSWVVTAPQSILEQKNPEVEKKFFEETYNFLKKKYGEQNIISAYVHKDETTPHIHFAFIPVVKDKAKGIEKVSAKECITLSELKTFHKNLDIYLTTNMGLLYGQGILNDATRQGNNSIEELKRKSAAKRLDEAKIQSNEMIEKAKEKAAEFLEKAKISSEHMKFKEQQTADLLFNSQNKAIEIENSIKILEKEKQALKRQIDALKGSFNTSYDIPHGNKAGILGDRVSFTKEEAANLIKTAKAYWGKELSLEDARRDVARAEARAEHAETSATGEENNALRLKINELEKKHINEIQRLRIELQKANSELDKIWKVFDRNPEILESVRSVLGAIAKEQKKDHGFER